MSSSDLSDHEFNDFSDFLANTLRVGTDLRVYHVSTAPTPTASIYAPPPGKQDEPTTCESHFLAVSQPHLADAADTVAHATGTNGDDDTRTTNHVLVFGIEVLIFTTGSLTTIFVSKADSSGFLTRPTHSSQPSSSIIRTVTSAFLEWLVCRNLSSSPPDPTDVTRHEVGSRAAVDESTSSTNEAGNVPDRTPGSQERRRGRRLVLSLFARSQNQYLFPGSIENATKHVLDDRQLIKWWCRVLDGLVERVWRVRGHADPAGTPSTSVAETNINCDAASAQTTPLSTSVNATATTTANIQPQAYVIVPGCDRSATVRSFFPPSARHPRSDTPPKWHNSYPDQYLVGSNSGHSSSDASTLTPALPIRCMIPRLPDDPKARYCEDLDNAGTDDQGRWRDIRSLPQFWETMEYRQECAAGRLVGFVWVTFGAVHDEPATASTASGVSDTSTPHLPDGHAQPARAHPAPRAAPEHDATHQARRSITLSAPQYNTLAAFLLNDTDFAGRALATTSTTDWIAKASELAGAPAFGVDVQGRAPAPAPAAPALGVATGPEVIGAGAKHARDEASGVKVNVLTGVRKKRKVADETTEHLRGDAHAATAANADTDAGNSGGVRTLAAGLVRKKPKAS